jgi:pimeloyl-ACP methyl ester carboxylesterase
MRAVLGRRSIGDQRPSSRWTADHGRNICALRRCVAFGSIPRMPWLERRDARIYYEEYGQGSPVLLLAPGGMRSSIEFWQRAPWNPIEALAPHFRVIAMDQRNAGRSTARVADGDGWDSYADDQLALLDHLELRRCALLGGCIGSAFALKLIARAEQRVAAAVLQNPIGLHENREAFYALFDGWAADVRKQQPDVPEGAWSAFRERMYGGEFVFSVPRDVVRRCSVSLLILEGSDPYHPTPISREIAALAPRCELVSDWKDPAKLPDVVSHVRKFIGEYAILRKSAGE